jgi:hypothetical protein
MTITITFHGDFSSSSMRYSAGWQDAERRYHVWLTPDGRNKDGVIHSNPLVDVRGRSDHRSLNLEAKKWAWVRAEIERSTTPEALAQAHAVWQAAEDARQAQLDEERRVEAQALFDKLWAQGFRPTSGEAG